MQPQRNDVPVLVVGAGPGGLSTAITLARQVSSLVPGDRVLCMGVGSGLNTSLCEIRW